jgi:hypothetical protein
MTLHTYKISFATIMALLVGSSSLSAAWYENKAIVGGIGGVGAVLSGISLVVYQSVKNGTPTYTVTKNSITKTAPFTFKRFWKESTTTQKAFFITGLIGAPVAIASAGQLVRLQYGKEIATQLNKWSEICKKRAQDIQKSVSTKLNPAPPVAILGDALKDAMSKNK